jgi:hypothetical protein
MAIYFTAQDEIRTLKYLGYTINDVVYLRTQQRLAYDPPNGFGDAIVEEVQTILDGLDALQELENTYALDASSSLIRADVLEWAPGARFENLGRRKSNLVNQLSTVFNMPIRRSGGNCGSTPVFRG